MNKFINGNILKIEKVVHGSSFDPDILDFSSSVVPLDIDINKIVSQSNIFSYPDGESRELKNVISELYQILPENIIIGNGSSELFLYISLVFLAKEKNVMLLRPTYGEYKRTAEISEAKINYYELKESGNFKIDIEDYINSIKESNSEIIYICNPNNPTGDYINQDKIEDILSKCKEKLFIIDLAYVDYTSDIINYNRFLNKYTVIFVNSLTKSFGIAGLRSGYTVASKEFISALNKVKIPWNMNVIAQGISIEILKNRDKYLQNVKTIKRESEILRLEIEKTGFKTISSSTDYFMVKVENSLKMQGKLLKDKILVRELDSMGFSKFIRVTGKDSKSNKRFLDIWKERISSQ